MKDMKPEKEALKSLIKVMKSMHIKKMHGYSEADDDIPSIIAKEADEDEAKALSKKAKAEEEMEDEEEDED